MQIAEMDPEKHYVVLVDETLATKELVAELGKLPHVTAVIGIHPDMEVRIVKVDEVLRFEAMPAEDIKH